MRKAVGLMMVVGALGAGGALPAQAQSLGEAIGGIATNLLQQEVDRAAFAEAQRVNSITSYRAYIERFPSGLHRADADRALERLGANSTSTQNPAQADRAAFAEAQRRNTIVAYEDYIERYPQGIFRADAQLAVSQLRGGRPALPEQSRPTQPSVDTPAAVEARIGLSRTQRTNIQQQLTRLGYDTRGADGAWGPNTRNAIRAWQGANSQSVTGYVTAQQVQMIGSQAGNVTVAPTPPVNQDAQSVERGLGLSVAERREVQLRLTLLGYDTKGTTGDFGNATREAVRSWQRSQGATVTGYLTSDQIRALQRQTRG